MFSSDGALFIFNNSLPVFEVIFGLIRISHDIIMLSFKHYNKIQNIMKACESIKVFEVNLS